MKSIKLYFFFLISLLLFVACGDTKEKTQEDGETIETIKETVNLARLIEGSWETTEIKRNGKPIDIGKSIFLKYDADGTFTSTLFDANKKEPYANGVAASIDGYTISFENLPDTFHIDKITTSDLVLSTSIRNYPFEFIFKKAK